MVLSQEMIHSKWQDEEEEEEEEGIKNDVAEGASLGRQVLLPAPSPICISTTSTATTLLGNGRTVSVYVSTFLYFHIYP